MKTENIKPRESRLAFQAAAAAVMMTLSVFAQVQSASMSTSGDYACVQRNSDSKIWQRTVIQTNQAGVASTNSQSYTEMATGMCYLNENGEYVDSAEKIDAVADGAQAVHGQHQVWWAPNANTPRGAMVLTTPDGKQLACTVFGLAYYDLASGSNAAIAQLQDCTGSIVPPNQVVYTGAFSNLEADVQYTYRISGLSQDIVLRQAPPAPHQYGLPDDTAILQVYTEFFDPPEPAIDAATNADQVDEQILDFGIMKMVQGHALLLSGQNGQTSPEPVSKRWTQIDGRTFLIESISYSAISNQLQQLPQAFNQHPRHGSARKIVLLDSKPAQTHGSVKAAPMKQSKLSGTKPKFVMDYDTVITSTNNITFQGDTTYYISNSVNCTGTTIFEGGSVIKFNTNTSLQFYYPAEVNWMGTNYSPTVLTAKDDNSAGLSITGSTGNPSGYYASTAISLNGSDSTYSDFLMSHFRISYAEEAVYVSGLSITAELNDGQIVNCESGIVSPGQGTVTMENMLFANFTYAIELGNATATAVNSTFDGNLAYSELATVISGNPAAYARLTNCVIANVTQFSPPARPAYPSGPMAALNSGAYNGFYNSGEGSGAWYTNEWFGSSPITTSSNPFQTVGAGGYYLTNGCAFKDAGTTNVGSVLLADLQAKTTYPPTNF